MRNAKVTACLLAFALLFQANAVLAAKTKKKPSAPVPLADAIFSFTKAPLPAHAKIFLFAGSSLSAAFAREVSDQRRLWLKAGFSADEIVCYYIKPFQEDLIADTKRFLEVAPEISSCYPASVKLLREHLAKAGQASPRPPFLYLYLTSHGERPVSEVLKEATPRDEDYWALVRGQKYPVFEQHQLLVEGLPDGSATSTEVLGALRAGMPEEELYLTPKHLRALLYEHFADIPKFVVLQGCYTGGFIKGGLDALSPITVLTASAPDRTSFGCEPGAVTTYFGGAYNEALSQGLADPRSIAWPRLYDAVSKTVVREEKKIKGEQPSSPQYFSNFTKNGS